MEQLKIFFSLLIEENTEEEKSFLDTAVYQAYQKKGIGNDNSTLFKDPRNRMAGMKEMPILEDVYNELGNLEQKRPKHQAVTKCLSSICSWSKQNV